MVGKLFKHEIKYYLRSLMFVEIILIAIALMTRFVQLFENDSVVYSIVNTSSIIMLVITMLVAVFLTTVMGVVRFYKNLFSHEGYLSFTLPVTTTQQLFVKITTYMMFMAITVVSLFVAFSVATMGDVFLEVSKAGIYILKYFGKEVGTLNVTLYIIEAIVYLTFATVYQMLLFYACMSIGQLTGKNRILLSVGAYFAAYVVTQIVETLFIVIYSILANTDIMEWIKDFISNNMELSVHIGICFGIVVSIVLSAVAFIVSNRIISHKLNLE
ncbi:MAG: hypothetical protein IKT35_00765, partial [Clostridia bacterium]|nr:hypothetical protein [Clostridia bacterium]